MGHFNGPLYNGPLFNVMALTLMALIAQSPTTLDLAARYL